MVPTRTMDLGDLLGEYAPVRGDDWVTATADILDDVDECRIVLDLADELIAAGRFDEPVRLDAAGADEDGDWPAEVGNGMHRICAHVVTAHTDVLVTDHMDESTDGWWQLRWDTSTSLTDDQWGCLLSVSSFRLTPSCWVRCEIVSGDPGGIRAMIVGATEDLGPTLLGEMTPRFEGVGLTLTNGTCRWTTLADLDD